MRTNVARRREEVARLDVGIRAENDAVPVDDEDATERVDGPVDAGRTEAPGHAVQNRERTTALGVVEIDAFVLAKIEAGPVDDGVRCRLRDRYGVIAGRDAGIAAGNVTALRPGVCHAGRQQRRHQEKRSGSQNSRLPQSNARQEGRAPSDPEDNRALVGIRARTDTVRHAAPHNIQTSVASRQ